MQARLTRSEEVAAQIAEQESRSAELAQQIAAQTAELTALTRVRDAAAPAPEVADAGDDGIPQSPVAPEAAMVRRNPAQVDAALALAPALPPAGEQLTRLRDMLIQGHCPTEALAQVQDPINRQTLLALVSRLGGCRGS